MIFKQETVKSWFTGIKTSINNEVIQPFQNAEQVIWKYNQAIQHNSLTQKGWERLLSQSDDGLKAYLTNIKGTTASMTGYTVSLQGNITGFKKVSSTITQYNALATSGIRNQNEFSTAVTITNGQLGGYLRGLNGAKASLSGYVSSLVGATAKTVALQAATMALNAAVSMGITAAVSLAIKGFDKFINSAKRASDAANEAFSESNSKVQQNKEELKSLDELIEKYKELKENENLDTDGRKEVKNLQNDIADLVGIQAKNLNLVNGKLDEEIDKLNEISVKQAKNAYETATANYNNAVKANKNAAGDSSIAFADGYAYVGNREKEAEKILQDAGFINYYMQGGRQHVGGRGVGNNGLSTIVFDTYDKDGNLLKGAQEKADYLQSLIDVLEQNGQMSTNLYAGLIKQRNTYLSYLDNQENAANSLIDSWITYSQYANEALSKINVDSVESFEEYRQKMIDEAKNDESIGQILADGTLSEDALEVAINDFMATATQFSTWYEQWVDTYDYRNTLASAKSKFGDTLKLEINTDELNEAKENLKYEYEKLSDWGLDDYAQDIKNDTIQSLFGNVDMDKRTIITWSDELKQTYADALASWDYNPEIGGIDTVFGGSARFGEEINGTGWEVAFTPILPDGTFLSSDTVYEYIESIVAEAYAANGEVTEDALTSIDAQGRQIGDTFVHGIFAAVDDSLNYDNNGNLAETIGRLMHFSGDFGAVELAKQEIENAKELIDWDSWFSKNVKTPREIEVFQQIIEEANSATDAIEKYNTIRKDLVGETPVSFPSISETIDQLNTQLKPTFDSLKSAYQDIFTTDDDGKSLFTLENVDLSMLDDIKSKIDDINKNEELGIHIDYSEFENLATILTDTSSTADEVHNAFNSFATDVVSSLNPAISECSGENYKLIQTLLESLGIINAEEVMISSLGYSYDEYTTAKQECTDAGYDLSNMTEEEINQFIMEQIESGNCGEALANLQLKKLLVNDTKIDTSGDIQQILNLASAAGMNADVLNKLAKAKSILAASESGTYIPASVIADAMNDVENAKQGMLDWKPANIDFSPQSTSKSSKSSKSGGGSNKKETDAWLEEYKRKLKELENMRDKGRLMPSTVVIQYV